MCFKSLIALALAVSSTLYAREYYVATDGKDSNSGTISSPWATVRRGVDVYNAGDTIYVRGGTYAPTGSMYFYRPGTSAAPITFRAYPGESAVLDGANMATDANVVYISAPHFVMQDFEIKNGNLNGVTVENTSNVTIRNCKVHDAQHSGIYVGKRDMSSTHDITVEGCTIYHNVHMNDAHALNSGWAGALVAGGAVNVTFKNNTVYENQGEGIIFYLADRCSALGNVSHDNFGVNLYLDNATNCTVSGNFLYSSGETGYYAHGQAAAGIQCADETYNISNPSANNTLVNNILVKNSYGFYFGAYGAGGALKNFTFANNTIHLSSRQMIHVDAAAHSNATFCNNISFQSNGGAQAGVPSSLAGLDFSHNLWYGGDVGAAWDDSDLYADPMLVNPGTFIASDYKLQSTSPAIQKGVNVSGVTTDFFGTLRTTPVDLGAIADGDAPTNPNQPAAPVFTSDPTVSPNPASVGQNVIFTASATDANGDALLYTWNLGDGSQFTGASVTKVYSNAGTYLVTVTVSDGTANAISAISVTVSGGDSNNPIPLAISTMGLTFNLSKPNADSMRVLGSVSLPIGFRPAGAGAGISIGGFQHPVTLNQRGISTDRTFRLAGRISRGTFTTTNLNFVLTIKRRSLFAQMSTLALSDTPGVHSQQIPVSLNVGGIFFTGTIDTSYLIIKK